MKVKSIKLQNLDAPDGEGYGSTDVVLVGEAGEQVTLTGCPIYCGVNNIFTGSADIDELEAVAWVCSSRDRYQVPDDEMKAWESQRAGIEMKGFELPEGFRDCGTLSEAIEKLLWREPEVRTVSRAALQEEIERLEEEEEEEEEEEGE